MAIGLTKEGAVLTTPAGALSVRAVIVAVSTQVLAKGGLKLPGEAQAWHEAAARLPLGRNEKIFLEIVGASPFEPETHLMGNPRDSGAASYYIRPFGHPVIECFLGGAGAEVLDVEGPAAAFERGTEELVGLFGSQVRRSLRLLAASSWGRMNHIGGGYSHALPGHVGARKDLARPCEGRIFFAGEATHPYDYGTAHGAHDSGVRAAEDALSVLEGPETSP